MKSHFLSVNAVTLFLILGLAGCGQTIVTGPGQHAKPIPEGTTSSGGGDSLEMEFKILGRSLERRLKERNPKLHTAYHFDAWLAALERGTMISLDERPNHDGRPVDAINYPTRSLVEVYGKRWQMLNASERERLILHEVFGLMDIKEIKDKGYLRTDIVLQNLESVTVVGFHTISIDGPTALDLVENFDWNGGSVLHLPALLSPDKHPRYLVSVLYKDEPFIHCYGSTDEPMGRKVGPNKKIQLQNPSCLVHVDGILQGSHTAIFGRGNNRSGKFQEFWRRLGGTAKEFNFPSIQGIAEFSEQFFEIQMHLELRRSLVRPE